MLATSAAFRSSLLVRYSEYARSRRRKASSYSPAVHAASPSSARLSAVRSCEASTALPEYYATRVPLRAGANLRQIEELLGHKHLDSTQRCTRVNAHETRSNQAAALGRTSVTSTVTDV